MNREIKIYNLLVALIAVVSLVLSFTANIKDTKTYSVGLNSTISGLTELTSPSHNDVFAIVDTANTQTKKIKWGTATSTLKTLFDTFYSPVFTTSSGLRGIISDETGTGIAVFNDTPTILTPTIASFVNSLHNHTNNAGGGQLTDSAFSSAIGISKGGTGQTSAQAAIDALLPSQTSNSGKVLTTDGTNASWGSFGKQVNYQSFPANGTWTKPSGFSTSSIVIIQMWGGGGGAGGVDTSASARSGAGGGGAFLEIRKKLSDLSSTESVTVGSGGTGGAAGVNNGTAGGSSSFGSHGTAYGGGFGSANSGSVQGAGGGGGGIFSVGGNGTIGSNGGAGGNPAGSSAQTSNSGFGGGGGANFNGGGTVAGSSAFGGGGGGANTGAGGASIYGGGGGGSDTSGGTSIYGGAGGGTTSNQGQDGTIPGGGGGASNSSGSTARAGGNGARGEVRVWVIE